MSAVVAQSGPDVGVAWHYGDPMREQRLLDAGDAVVDLSHRGVITVTGPDRLGWLHSLTTQYLEGLEPGRGVTTLVLSPHGHIEHVLYGVDDGDTFWAHTEPGAAPALVGWLDKMRFLMRVEVSRPKQGLRGRVVRRRPHARSSGSGWTRFAGRTRALRAPRSARRDH